MKSIRVLLASLALVSAKTERYIITYDDHAWDTLSLRFLPTNTVHILKELKMQVADLDMDEVREFNTIPGVTLQKDSLAYIAAEKPSFVQHDPKNWGLDRIDQQSLPLDKQYHFESIASDVDAYILDTGVTPDHNEFGGRAVFEKNFVEDNKDYDCHGHGTHVSSTIAGLNVGVAKGARVHGIKVCDCGGSCPLSGLLAGINHVVSEHKKTPGRKSVINMSLRKAKDETFNKAVATASKEGVVVVVAAGNDATDACNYSPSSAPEAIVVAASNITDTTATFSNRGECVTLFAPGVGIYGAWNTGKDAYYTASGTSMASPHMAGGAALALSKGVAPADVKEYLVKTGTKGAIKDAPAKTANVLLYIPTTA